MMTKEIFENIGKTITKAADTAVSKTEDFFTVTKIKGKIAEEDRMIRQICEKIGRQVYEEYINGTVYTDAVADLCKDIERHESAKKEQQRDLDLFRSQKTEAYAEETCAEETCAEETHAEEAYAEEAAFEDEV